MNKLKKLILTMLLLCSTTTFANTGGGGFDDPVKLFKFYVNLADKAMKYRKKHGDYNPAHIKKLAPHVYAANKKYYASARHKLSTHESYVGSRKSTGKRKGYPLIVDIKQLKPSFEYGSKDTLNIPYTYYRYQQQTRSKPRLFKARAKKIGNKVKWFVYL